MLEVTESWDTCQGKLQTRCGISPRERTMLQSAKVKGVGNLKSYLISDGDAEFRVCHARCYSYVDTVFPHCVPFSVF